jgi:hypothetical protein
MFCHPAGPTDWPREVSALNDMRNVMFRPSSSPAHKPRRSSSRPATACSSSSSSLKCGGCRAPFAGCRRAPRHAMRRYGTTAPSTPRSPATASSSGSSPTGAPPWPARRRPGPEPGPEPDPDRIEPDLYRFATNRRSGPPISLTCPVTCGSLTAARRTRLPAHSRDIPQGTKGASCKAEPKGAARGQRGPGMSSLHRPVAEWEET